VLLIRDRYLPGILDVCLPASCVPMRSSPMVPRWKDPSRVAYNVHRLVGLPYADQLRPSFSFRIGPAEAKDGQAPTIEIDLGAHKLTAEEVST
jgi:hypothetical protein